MKIFYKFLTMMIVFMVVVSISNALMAETQVRYSWTLPANIPEDMVSIEVLHNNVVIDTLPITTTEYLGQIEMIEGDNIFSARTVDSSSNRSSEDPRRIFYDSIPPPPLLNFSVEIVK